MVLIVDYGMGNLMSVQKAVAFLGRRATVTSSPSLIKRAEKLIFPGVGHFGKAVRELKTRKIYKLLKERIDNGVPFLGICLGMQLLLEESQEAPGIKGLGVIKGEVKKFKSKKLIIPHMGWNQIKIKSTKSNSKGNNLFKGVKSNSYFYFAHSYYCDPKERVNLSTTDYGVKFSSSFGKKNVWGVQFHPEKSQALGLRVLKNFLNIC